MLTDLNNTSPTGGRQNPRLDGRNVSADILDRFARLSRQLRG
jgi:hypothetical protein